MPLQGPLSRPPRPRTTQPRSDPSTLVVAGLTRRPEAATNPGPKYHRRAPRATESGSLHLSCLGRRPGTTAGRDDRGSTSLTALPAVTGVRANSAGADRRIQVKGLGTLTGLGKSVHGLSAASTWATVQRDSYNPTAAVAVPADFTATAPVTNGPLARHRETLRRTKITPWLSESHLRVGLPECREAARETLVKMKVQKEAGNNTTRKTQIF